MPPAPAPDGLAPATIPGVRGVVVSAEVARLWAPVAQPQLQPGGPDAPPAGAPALAPGAQPGQAGDMGAGQRRSGRVAKASAKAAAATGDSGLKPGFLCGAPGGAR